MELVVGEYYAVIKGSNAGKCGWLVGFQERSEGWSGPQSAIILVNAPEKYEIVVRPWSLSKGEHIEDSQEAQVPADVVIGGYYRIAKGLHAGKCGWVVRYLENGGAGTGCKRVLVRIDGPRKYGVSVRPGSLVDADNDPLYDSLCVPIQEVAPNLLLAESPERASEEEDCRKTIEDSLKQLPKRVQTVLRLRFGLDDGRYHRLDDVAKEMGCSRERVRQIESQGLSQLRSTWMRAPLYAHYS